MSFKLALGAVVAAVTGLFLMPGIASAEEPSYDQEIFCHDGTFSANLDYNGGPENRIIILEIEGDRFDGNSNDYDNVVSDNDADASLTASHLDEGPGDGNFNFSNSRDRWEADESGAHDDFFVLEGNYEDVDAADTGIGDDVGAFDFEVWLYGANSDPALADTTIPDGTNPLLDASPGEAGDTLQRSLSTDDFWEECGQSVCINGDANIEQLSFQGEMPTNDCGYFNACIDGEVERIQEHDANQAGIEEGVCDFEDPPEITTTSTEEVESTVETAEPSEEEAVAEVSPAVDVVALPSAGYADTGVNYAWVGLLALALAGFGGATALMARQRK
jgi:hypothetical protein